jgi:aldehyde:ferredoxin oxidoreductase
VPDSPGLGWYLGWLYEQGHIGPGTAVDTSPLPMDQYDSFEFAEAYAQAIATRTGIGDLLAEGTIRFAEAIGRLSDTDTVLRYPQWGCVFHWTLPQVEWPYGGLMGARDTNHHDFNDELGGGSPWSPVPWTTEEVVNIAAEKTIPYTGDPFMFDYSWQGDQAYETGIYSPHKAKQVAWHRHYGSFWKESVLYCDEVLASWTNKEAEGYKGSTPFAEPAFFNAVTGKNMSFADAMEIGRKIWNLKRAIRVLQGRHRDQEVFSGFMYRPGAAHMSFSGVPVYDGAEWSHQSNIAMYFTEAGVETWKSHFYLLEGWNNYTGWPTRSTLEGVGLGDVADYLEAKGKLGEE